jgi:iron complex outermembrane receptor protein/hemoglobin/transferrin/lactoferrin receptor protein
VHRTWFPVVGHAGVEWQAAEAVELLFNYDNSYRAPNLDDMTARQQTGPGFQFENPRLRPERANTFELGGRIRTRRFVADLWVFETLLAGNIIKVSKAVEDCPVNTPQCQSSWSRFKLENAPTVSEIRGTEISMKLWLPARVSVRATTAYAWSEGPRVGGLAYGSDGVTLGDRVPLSRTPPLHGTAELGWRHTSGFSAGAALQWAAAQRRLAIADYADGRIPKYGTPGFAVLHLRAGSRLGTELVVAVVLENVFDSPYRFHGSSVNGAGRGLIVQLEAAHAFSGRDDPQGEENP